MKCPYCGAPTSVTDTRIYGAKVLRKRLCFNMHKLTTEEKNIRAKLPKTP